MIKIGDRVEKISGYKYPGIVVAKFKKLNSIEERFVVECTEASCAGMLHIFREGQLKKTKDSLSSHKWWKFWEGKKDCYDL